MTDRFRILFVCTGNTCRSPMAEAIARDRLRAMGWDHVEVTSAGTSSFGSSPASEGALSVAGKRGLDLSEHRSRPLTADLLHGVDLVLAMTPGHLMRVVELGGGGSAALLTSFAAGEDGEDEAGAVPDPFGGPEDVYEETYRRLESLVERVLSRLEPVLAP
jgi:protein-tyrosine-phosphatase